MLKYAKFIKESMLKNQKLDNYETVKLIEECSAILQRKLPQKFKDLDSFTIPCIIREVMFYKALHDLGASINLVSLEIYPKLDLEEVK